MALHQTALFHLDQLGPIADPASHVRLAVPHGEALRLVGWALDAARRRPAAAIELVLDGVRYRAAVRFPRPDVAAAYAIRFTCAAASTHACQRPPSRPECTSSSFAWSWRMGHPCQRWACASRCCESPLAPQAHALSRRSSGLNRTLQIGADDRDGIPIAAGELFAPGRVPERSAGCDCTARASRQPRHVDEWASHRPQPHAEHLLVQDTDRLLLEAWQPLRGELKSRMPGHALPNVRSRQPPYDVALVAGTDRSVGAEGVRGIAAEEPAALGKRHERSERPDDRRREKEETGADPMLRRIHAEPYRLVVAIHVPQADRSTAECAQHGWREAVQVAGVKRVESAGGEMNGVVFLKARARMRDGPVEGAELPDRIVASKERPVTGSLDDGRGHRVVDDDGVPMNLGQLPRESLVDLLLGGRISVESVSNQNGEDSHGCGRELAAVSVPQHSRSGKRNLIAWRRETGITMESMQRSL